MDRLRTIALIVSVALHVGTGAVLVLLSEGRVEQGGGDTPMEVSLDPSAASRGNGPPIDAGPSEPPPQVGESTPPETPQASEPQPVETTPPPEEKPQAEKPQEERPPKSETPPPPQESKETPPAVVKSAPDFNTPEVVASEPPPPKPAPPTPKPPAPKPPPPKPPPPKATAGGAAGGAPATGRVRTRNAGTAIDRGAQMTCAAGVRSRLRRPVGSPPRPFSVQITVSSSGALLSARLGSSSGSPAMDQAALAAVRGSAPFPACPGIGGFLPITIPFR